MSKLFSDDAPEVRRIPTPRKSGAILRHRKKHPLHPETIKDLLREKADATPSPEKKLLKWLLILYPSEQAIRSRSDGASFLANTKQYCDLEGSYEDAARKRNDVMESGDYDQAWLILKTDRDR